MRGPGAHRIMRKAPPVMILKAEEEGKKACCLKEDYDHGQAPDPVIESKSETGNSLSDAPHDRRPYVSVHDLWKVIEGMTYCLQS